jgi:hypothetical protein
MQCKTHTFGHFPAPQGANADYEGYVVRLLYGKKPSNEGEIGFAVKYRCGCRGLSRKLAGRG